MKARIFTYFSLLFAFLAGAPQYAQAETCTQILDPGANVASAVSAAANGSVICLNSGNYGTVNFTNIKRSGFVTVQSASGLGARMAIGEIYDSRYIKFDSLTFDWVSVRECSTDIQFLNSTWIPGGGGLVFNYTQPCSQTDMRLLVDNGTFSAVSRAGYEGRLSARSVSGLTISNSLFEKQPSTSGAASDGIMLVGNSTNVTIGPGNLFRDIVQSQCGSVHCDAIQMYGNGSGTVINGNYFVNNTVHIGNYDGGSPNMKIVHNVFDGGQTGQNLQIGGVRGMLMEHNTFHGVVLGIGTKSGDTQHSGWVVQNNIFDAAKFTASGDQPGCGSDCVMRFNLKSNGGSTTPTGTNSITANAIYVGTGSPTNWSGWQLATTSPGKNAGNDGQDMGVLFSTTESPTTPLPTAVAPSPPTGLTVK
ncbi:MAG: hypothetical protein ROZ64_18010 [Burkholderiaceae bacterium]|jgi:hypothetical protein|nr:hypothetical protein [Burkholderiaceae bacterium]